MNDAELRERHPALRQSLLASWDRCSLATKFDLQGVDVTTAPQARGLAFHRVAAGALAWMRERGEDRIAPDIALGILEATLANPEHPRVPVREQHDLRWTVAKWANDNTFNIAALVAVEEQLEGTLVYDTLVGERSRQITGRPDALLARPPDGAVVIDWKDTWRLPPAPAPDIYDSGTDHISPEGYFQQRVYGWLVMQAFPAVQYVTLREFYVRYSEVREATIERDALPGVEAELATLVATLDAALMNESDDHLWPARPGAHCSWCPNPGACPIATEERGEGAIEDEDTAIAYARQRVVLDALRDHRTKALKAWVDANGPVAISNGDRKLQIGWTEDASGRRSFKVHA